MAFFYLNSAETCEIGAAFPFLKEPGHIISLVGAGGKTSLLYEMARFSASQSLNTLVTTTTHIFKPELSVYADDWNQVKRLWDSGSYAVVGNTVSDGKLSMLPQEKLYQWIEQADLVLIEADGSKRMPVKVPGRNEPVILPESDIIIGVLGISALNRPLRNVCFRLEQAMDVLKIDADSSFTEIHAAQILSSELGTRKYVGQRFYMAVLNQCDYGEKRKQGERILELLARKGIPGVMSCFKGDSI